MHCEDKFVGQNINSLDAIMHCTLRNSLDIYQKKKKYSTFIYYPAEDFDLIFYIM
jgi:hypothetical protein